MLNQDFETLFDLIKAFPDEAACIEHLEELRWGDEIYSPFDRESKIYMCKNGRYRCRTTGKYFNVKTGTMFENTKVGLQKWFMAIWLVTIHKKGISSVQLSKDIGVTQKTSWFMLQRIRACFGLDTQDEVLEGDVEVDETFVGGKNKNRHADKKVKYSQGRSFKDKTPVIGAISRGGRLVCRVIPNTSRPHLHSFVRDHVAEGSNLHSDEWRGYNGLSVYYNHRIIDHSAKQYVDGEVHSNTIEGAWSHLKRSIFGIYHWVSRKHLHLYVNGFMYRYNNRNKSNTERFNLVLLNSECRTTYRQLIAA